MERFAEEHNNAALMRALRGRKKQLHHKDSVDTLLKLNFCRFGLQSWVKGIRIDSAAGQSYTLTEYFRDFVKKRAAA